jgi:anti-anti-sigma regulatory factor
MTVSCWAARWTVYLAGELDGPGGRQAQHLVDSMVDAGVTQVDVDLHAVTVADASGKAALARLARAMDARSVKVRILAAG